VRHFLRTETGCSLFVVGTLGEDDDGRYVDFHQTISLDPDNLKDAKLISMLAASSHGWLEVDETGEPVVTVPAPPVWTPPDESLQDPLAEVPAAEAEVPVDSPTT
jgi:hypothetical protein